MLQHCHEKCLSIVELKLKSITKDNEFYWKSHNKCIRSSTYIQLDQELIHQAEESNFNCIMLYDFGSWVRPVALIQCFIVSVWISRLIVDLWFDLNLFGYLSDLGVKQAFKLSVEIFVTKNLEHDNENVEKQQITGFMKCIIFHSNASQTHCTANRSSERTLKKRRKRRKKKHSQTMHMHKCASSEKKK